MATTSLPVYLIPTYLSITPNSSKQQFLSSPATSTMPLEALSPGCNFQHPYSSLTEYKYNTLIPILQTNNYIIRFPDALQYPLPSKYLFTVDCEFRRELRTFSKTERVKPPLLKEINQAVGGEGYFETSP